MIEAKVTGIPDLREALRGIVPKLRVRALRNALAAGARVVKASARAATPVINPLALPVRRGYRKPGTVKNAISVRTSKMARRAGDVGVFINVRPAKGASIGSKKSSDPYYWAWVNYGHKIIGAFKGNYRDFKLRGRGRLTGLAKRRRAPLGFVPGRHFMEAGAKRLPEALQVFLVKIIPAIEKLNKPKAPAP